MLTIDDQCGGARLHIDECRYCVEQSDEQVLTSLIKESQSFTPGHPPIQTSVVAFVATKSKPASAPKPPTTRAAEFDRVTQSCIYPPSFVKRLPKATKGIAMHVYKIPKSQ